MDEADNLGVEGDYILTEKILRRKSSFDDPKKQRSVSMMMDRINSGNIYNLLIYS